MGAAILHPDPSSWACQYYTHWMSDIFQLQWDSVNLKTCCITAFFKLFVLNRIVNNIWRTVGLSQNMTKELNDPALTNYIVCNVHVMYVCMYVYIYMYVYI